MCETILTLEIKAFNFGIQALVEVSVLVDVAIEDSAANFGIRIVHWNLHESLETFNNLYRKLNLLFSAQSSKFCRPLRYSSEALRHFLDTAWCDAKSNGC